MGLTYPNDRKIASTFDRLDRIKTIRDAGAATDIVMQAEILTYSRSRGLFAGVSLEGSTLRVDSDANERLYGKKIDGREIVRTTAVPEAARSLVATLNNRSPKNLSNRK